MPEIRVPRPHEVRHSTSAPSAWQSPGKLIEVLHASREFVPLRPLPELLDLLAREAARLLEADRASIFLLDPDKKILWSQVALGSPERLQFDARLGIAGAAALSGETVIVRDAQKDRRFYPGVDAKSRYQTRSLIAVPLTGRDGDSLGAFEVLNKKRGSFRDEDAEVLKQLAAQAAVAIENARAHDMVQNERKQLAEENDHLRRDAEARFATSAILGTSDKVRRIVRTIEQISGSAVNVLITGESGTGKELIARAVHTSSSRSRGPMIALNCAALPENLIESELFGIERGVATGVDARIGRIEQASGGTLFLDEVGDLSLAAQAKLLRALQDLTIERVGGRRPIAVDARIVAATNRDLETEIRRKRFREDLFYRLNVISLRTPSLREIPEDIPLMAQAILARLCRETGRRPMKFTPGAMRALTRHPWPGNVRELENEMKRLVAVLRGPLVETDDLSDAVRSKGPANPIAHTPPHTSAHADLPGSKLRGSGSPSDSPGSRVSLKEAVEEIERRYIDEAIRDHDGNQLQAAKTLGLSRQGLINKIKRYRIKT